MDQVIIVFDDQKYYYRVGGLLLLNGVPLSSGDNPLPASALARLKEHPDFEQWLEMGCITIKEAPADPAASPADPAEILPDLSKLNAEQSIAAIKQISDRDALELLLEAEETGKNRVTVLDAINEQLEAI